MRYPVWMSSVSLERIAQLKTGALLEMPNAGARRSTRSCSGAAKANDKGVERFNSAFKRSSSLTARRNVERFLWWYSFKKTKVYLRLLYSMQRGLSRERICGCFASVRPFSRTKRSPRSSVGRAGLRILQLFFSPRRGQEQNENGEQLKASEQHIEG